MSGKESNNPETDARDYNTAFEKLVRDESDLEGLVAYALYKQHKRDWVVEYLNEHSQHPDKKTEDDVVKGLLIDPSAYKLRASNALLGFADRVVEERQRDIELLAIEKHVANSTDELKKAGGVWRSIWTQIISFFAVSIILILIALSVERTGVDLKDLFSPDKSNRSMLKSPTHSSGDN